MNQTRHLPPVAVQDPAPAELPAVASPGETVTSEPPTPVTPTTPTSPTTPTTLGGVTSQAENAETEISPVAVAGTGPTVAGIPAETPSSPSTPSKDGKLNVLVGVSSVSTETTAVQTPVSPGKFSKKQRSSLFTWTTGSSTTAASTSNNSNNASPEGLKIHWYTPTSMVLLGIAGFAGALAHHLYNASLDGTPVEDAQWPQRWGVALAFFVKMTLVGAVQIAVKQRAWLSVKKRGFKVKTLDSIFHACYDPLEFLNRELFLGAFFPALLSVLVWILPLSSIASPSTLTAASRIQTAESTCHNVSNLHFFLENGFGFWKIDPNGLKHGMSFWDAWVEPNSAYYSQPSADSRRLFQLSQLSEELLQQPISPCPSNSNCTFSVTFAAPSYKCEPRDDFGGQRLYTKSHMAPYGNLTYASYSSFEEDTHGGRPFEWDHDNVTRETGVFKEEPSLWIGWVWNTSVPATAEDAERWNTSRWRNQLRAHIVECTLWNSTYSYTLEYLQGKMNVSEKKVQHDRVLLPKGEVMSPDNEVYMEFSGFHGTAWLYRNVLAGNFTQEGQDTYIITKSPVSQTKIMDPGSGLPWDEDLAPRVEAAFHNIYLSFLSDTNQVSQHYKDVPCTTSSHGLVWSYGDLGDGEHVRTWWLIVPYAVAVGLTWCAIGIGLHAIRTNGYVAETNFSTFLATTRNPDLDRMIGDSEWSCLGASPLKKEMQNTRLRFGQVALTPTPTPASATPSRTQTGASDGGNSSNASTRVAESTTGEKKRSAPHIAFGFENRVTAWEKGGL